MILRTLPTSDSRETSCGKCIERGDGYEAKGRQPEVILIQWKPDPLASLVFGGFGNREEFEKPSLLRIGIDSRRIKEHRRELVHGSIGISRAQQIP